MKWLIPLTGFGATESGIHLCVFGIILVTLALVFVASEPAVAISDLGSVGVAGTVTAMS